MNLLAATERLASLDQPPIALDSSRCLRARDKFSTCDACVHACPRGALMWDGPIALDAQTCVACGLCLHLCPTGAFTGDDGVADLLNCAARLDGASCIEIVCPQHPAPERGPATSEAAIRTNTCLAALGPSALISLAALGVTQITLRLDACADCPLSNVKPQIERSIAIANQLLAVCGENRRVQAVGTSNGEDTRARPVVDAKNPPLSRRALFRLAVSEGPRLAARMLEAENAPGPGEKTPPRERRRLLNALCHLLPTEVEEAIGELPVARLAADEKCTACGVCARVCPTGALKLDVAENNQYRLTFAAGACVDCGLCVGYCEPGALRRTGKPVMTELLSSEPVVLRSGALRRCAVCRSRFASDTGETLCPLCEFRRQHPFGSRIPPGVKMHTVAEKAIRADLDMIDATKRTDCRQLH